ncbi:hypothetical protein BJ944DRAFT_87539 [Cunninghamella echinulata]|nr:hypothetical protein BJ944DRAFT_87539 [Cunninghamella echinulata]
MNLFLLALPTDNPSNYPKHVPGVLYLYDQAISLDDGYELSIQGVLAGIILFLLGLALILRGIVDSTGTLTRFNIGFITFGFVTWVMLMNFEPASTYGINRWSLYLSVVVAIGLFGGLFVCSCDKIAAHVALLGGLGGLCFGLWILGWMDGLSIQVAWGRAILLCILTLFWFFLASYSIHFNVLASSMTGAYLLMLGFDVYFHTGFTYCVLTALDANPTHGTYVTTTLLITRFVLCKLG